MSCANSSVAILLGDLVGIDYAYLEHSEHIKTSASSLCHNIGYLFVSSLPMCAVNDHVVLPTRHLVARCLGRMLVMSISRTKSDSDNR
jgi:hypothetical protein